MGPHSLHHRTNCSDRAGVPYTYRGPAMSHPKTNHRSPQSEYSLILSHILSHNLTLSINQTAHSSPYELMSPQNQPSQILLRHHFHPFNPYNFHTLYTHTNLTTSFHLSLSPTIILASSTVISLLHNASFHPFNFVSVSSYSSYNSLPT